jgi:hypothetical protein
MYAPVRSEFFTIQLAVFHKVCTVKALNSSFFSYYNNAET